MHDLVLKGGRVIDPASGTDRTTDVAFDGSRIAAVGDALPGKTVQDVTGAIVTPGLIDLHTHVYWGGTSLGVEADRYANRSAVTTLVDTGSAGPGNYAGFRAHVIERARTRVLVYIHISFAGIFAFSPTVMVGESEDIRMLASREAVEVAKADRDTIVGIKVRVGKHTSGPLGIAPLDIALQVADEADLPLMAHIDEPPPSYEEVVDRLRPGDVLTHCYRPFPNAPVYRDGQVKEALIRARDRGVLFDVGHGMGAFSWGSARHMMAAGFPPDTISSDVHALCVDGPAWDLLRTMNKFLALDMPLMDVVAAATVNPADAVRRDDIGRLSAGAEGDASVLRLSDDPIDLEDVLGEVVRFDQRLSPVGRVIGGSFEATK